MEEKIVIEMTKFDFWFLIGLQVVIAVGYYCMGFTSGKRSKPKFDPQPKIVYKERTPILIQDEVIGLDDEIPRMKSEILKRVSIHLNQYA